MPPVSDLLASFASAAVKPIVRKVSWPDSIPDDHPIKQLQLCVRFWPVAIASHLTSIITGNSPDWVQQIFWYVVVASTTNEVGETIFTSKWPEVWSDAVSKSELAYREWVLLPAAPGDPTLIPPSSIGTYDETGHLVIPPPDYDLLGKWLQTQYDNPQGKLLMWPLFEAALDYNGWKIGEGKNSETTNTSVPSGERPVGVAAP